MKTVVILSLVVVATMSGGSWDSYIDNLIGQSKDTNGDPSVDKACIIGLDGGASWTTSEQSNAIVLQGTEGADIAQCFKNEDFSSFMSSGIYVEGVKYQFLREEDNKIVLGNKKDHGAISMQVSKSAIVIAHTIEGKPQGNSDKAVAVIAEYLESAGY